MVDKPQYLPINHIAFDPKTGKPMIAGTGYTVEFLSGFLKHPDQWTVERIMDNFSFTRAQIYAAWAYYYDHQQEIEESMAADAEFAMRHTQPLSTLSGYEEYLEKKRAEKSGEQNSKTE